MQACILYTFKNFVVSQIFNFQKQTFHIIAKIL